MEIEDGTYFIEMRGGKLVNLQLSPYLDTNFKSSSSKICKDKLVNAAVSLVDKMKSSGNYTEHVFHNFDYYLAEYKKP